MKHIQFVKKNKFIILLILASFLLRIINPYFNDFYFDEAASWSIAKYSSITDIFFGNYSLEANMPLGYIILKFPIIISTDAFILRLYIIFFSIVGIVYFYRLTRLLLNRNQAYICSLLFALNPLNVYYSQFFRPYSIGFTFQIISLYFFYRLRREYSFHIILKFILFTILATFTTFSSFFLILYYLYIFVFAKLIKIRLRFMLLCVMVLIIIISGIWLLRYIYSSPGKVAIQSYVSYREKDYIFSAYSTIKDLLFFMPEWGGNYEFPQLSSKLIYLIHNFSKYFFLITTLLTLIKFYESLVTRPKNKQLVTNDVDREQFILFSIILTSALVISILSFNIVKSRLLLVIQIPFFILLTSAINNFIFRCPKFSKYIGQKVFYSILIILIISISLHNQSLRIYKFSKLYFDLKSLATEDNCTYIVASNAIAVDLLKYYDDKFFLQTNNVKFFLVNPVSNRMMNNLNFQLSETLNFSKKFMCKNIVRINYYDAWPTESQSYKLFEELLKSYTIKYYNSYDAVNDQVNIVHYQSP